MYMMFQFFFFIIIKVFRPFQSRKGISGASPRRWSAKSPPNRATSFREEGSPTGRVSYQEIRERKKDNQGGKRKVLSAERKERRVGDRRSGRGREFQSEGAAKEKERRPEQVFMRGTVRRAVLEDLSVRGGLWWTRI